MICKHIQIDHGLHRIAFLWVTSIQNGVDHPDSIVRVYPTVSYTTETSIEDSLEDQGYVRAAWGNVMHTNWLLPA